MGSKFIAALKCFFKCPADTMRLMLTLDSYESRAVDTIKANCPGIDVESVGFYAGLFLAIAFLAFCVMAYILSLLYGMGGI
ncbi:MAG: hypothetical protein ISS94_02245 [Candidatus Syntrophoarchaeum sp.]|nr:hypothetical protein [Methanomicrobia archaeon]MBL7117591.1 hypothetical protein [Candidatus Syntrophoarchaeum sp.]